MSKAWSARSAAERERLEAEFVLHHCIDLLLDEEVERAETMPEGAPRPLEPGERPSFAHLYRVLRSGGALPEGLSAALAADPALWADFALLLERSARQHLPRAAAASNAGSLERREADGCTLRLISSRAGDGQVYLLIELPEAGAGGPAGGHGAERSAVEEEGTSPSGQESESGGAGTVPPERLVVKTPTGAFLMEDLPPPETRIIRLVKAADDPVVRAVGEPASEIYLL